MAYTYLHAHTCMISRTQESTDELPPKYVGTSVYRAHTSICKIQTPINVSLITEQTEHNLVKCALIVWAGMMQILLKIK